jgi:hypothetical protein
MPVTGKRSEIAQLTQRDHGFRWWLLVVAPGGLWLPAILDLMIMDLVIMDLAPGNHFI